MTDQFTDVDVSGGTGKNPITNMGRVAVNGRIAQEEIEERQRLSDGRTRRQTYYGGKTEDRVFKAFPREIALTKRANCAERSTDYHDSHVSAFPVANGMGKRGVDTHTSLVQDHQFAGLVGGQGADFDRYGMTTGKHQEFALVLGGLATMVNTGTKHIRNGDPIYWELPPPDDPYDKSARNSERMVFHTMPYHPGKQSLNKATLSALMKGRGMRSDKTSPLAEGATNFRRAMMQQVVNAAHILLCSGIVTLSGDGEAAENGAQWCSAGNASQRSELYKILSRELGARDMRPRKYVDSITVEDGRSLAEFAIDAMVPTEDSHLILPLLPGGRTPGGDEGQIVRNQKNTIHHLMMAITASDDFYKQRIFAKALSPAEPGKEMDVILGKYSS